MVAAYRELAETRELLVAGLRNVLKNPAIVFSFQIIRPVAA